jgi:hypothetical protein
MPLHRANGGGVQPGATFSVGPTDPAALGTVPAGNEYVWIETDGAGHVVDVLAGKAASRWQLVGLRPSNLLGYAGTG